MQLSHESLGRLNHGQFADEIDASIAQALADALVRRGDKPRKVTIALEITPDAESNGELSIVGTCQVSLPKMKTEPTMAQATMVGKTWQAELPALYRDEADESRVPEFAEQH